MDDLHDASRPGPGDRTPPDLGVFLDHVTDDAKGWFEAQKEYTLLIVSERFGRMSAALAVVLLMGLLVAGAVLLGSLALGLYLGDLWNSLPLGILCVAGAYLILAMLFFIFGRRPIKDMIILHIINASRDEDSIS
ncbi:MAG: hypothetical protein KDC00_11230 [Flavobacteriales bacterium]|nr:hypothetical protein [Flavobacteriales bacterium]